jgi:hypothetical protein
LWDEASLRVLESPGEAGIDERAGFECRKLHLGVEKWHLGAFGNYALL